MNRLQYESSPYLLQHAHNPVHWNPWGEEAFKQAREEDKPILVSIGYAACHWCHVMERESFEDERTAALMNKLFVNIKIDREERPDLDHIYMNACQLITGAGGWPLHVFLTPDLLPFSAGTYFPPKPGYGKPSWLEVLMHMHTVFTNERDKVEEQAALLAEHILKMDRAFVSDISLPEGSQCISEAELKIAVDKLFEQCDGIDGGFGNAPKFPGAMALRFLLRYGYLVGNERALAHVQLSLDKMRLGGIYDHIGGGFARYAVDKKWFVPHFEKMLYDNALLTSVYAESFRATGNVQHKMIMEDILLFVDREMTSPEGGFYAAYDADSEGVEGKYYTFTTEEWRELLGSDAPLASAYYHVAENGNWEHTNILFRSENEVELCNTFQLSPEQLRSKIADIRMRIFEYRAQRIKPGLDNKIILGWNALMCSAYAEAFKATQEDHYRDVAIRNLQCLNDLLTDPHNSGRMLHHVTNGVTGPPAFLEDYAALIQALLDVYDITGDIRYLNNAEMLAAHVINHFTATGDMFYFTADYQYDLPLRSAEYYDNATPSGNSMMAMNFRRLFMYTGNAQYDSRAQSMLLQVKASYLRYGQSFGNWLMAASTYVFPFAEIVVAGPAAGKMRDAALARYFPHAIYVSDETGTGVGPHLQGRFHADVTQIFLCRNFTCHQPVTNVQDFLLMEDPL